MTTVTHEWNASLHLTIYFNGLPHLYLRYLAAFNAWLDDTDPDHVRYHIDFYLHPSNAKIPAEYDRRDLWEKVLEILKAEVCPV